MSLCSKGYRVIFWCIISIAQSSYKLSDVHYAPTIIKLLYFVLSFTPPNNLMCILNSICAIKIFEMFFANYVPKTTLLRLRLVYYSILYQYIILYTSANNSISQFLASFFFRHPPINLNSAYVIKSNILISLSLHLLPCSSKRLFSRIYLTTR